MILVTVGNHVQSFDRLLRAVDELAGQVEEKIIVQRGHSGYEPQHAEHFQFTSGEHMEQLTREARVQISHAGSGSILTALRLGKPLVVAPRRQCFNEHIDDHQLQLAGAMEADGRLVAVYEITSDTLHQAIKKVVNLSRGQATRKPGQSHLVQVIRQYLDEVILAAPGRVSRREV